MHAARARARTHTIHTQHAHASLQVKLGNLSMAASYYVDAGDVGSKADFEASLRYYAMAVTNFVKEGRFLQAAVVERKLSELCKEERRYADAGRAFSYTGELYSAAFQFQQGALMYFQSGVSFVNAGEYKTASDAFMAAVEAADSDNLTRYRVPFILLDACLCLFATADVGATEKLIMYASRRFPAFATRPQRKFVFELVQCAKDLLYHDFIDHVWNYDYVVELVPFELEYVPHALLVTCCLTPLLPNHGFTLQATICCQLCLHQ